MFDKLSDLDLINNIKEKKCEDSLIELIKRHENIYYDMFHYYKKIIKSKQLIFEELLDDVKLNIYKAALEYDPSKQTKFSTYLANSTRFLCLKLIYNKPNIESIDTEENKNIKIELNNRTISLEESNTRLYNIYSIIDNLTDERAKKIFHLRFSDTNKSDRTWSSIGKKMGLSTQTVINIFNKNLKLIKYKLKSNVDFY